MKTAIRKISSPRDFLNCLGQMYLVYETHLNVSTAFEEIPALFEVPTAARIFEFAVHLEELLSHMHPTSYGSTEPHLRLFGKVPLESWKNWGEMSQR